MSERRRTKSYQIPVTLSSVVLVALILLVASACSSNPTQTSIQPTPTHTAYQEGTGGLSANGTLLPARQVRLSFGAGGALSERLVDVGDRVSSGQTVARLDESTAQLELQAAQ